MPHAATVTLTGEQVAGRIRQALPDAVRSVGPGFVVLEPAQALEAMALLRDDETLDGQFLVQLCSVDMITRIDVVYHFSSLARNHIFCVKVPADHEQPEVPSVTSLWLGARLQEREVYDLMGVRFAGHQDLSRLFLWDKFPGHPLRKDFMALPGGQKPGLSQFPKQAAGQTGGEFRPGDATNGA